MCKLVDLTVGDRKIKVADIKKAYIKNIIDSISLCSEIDKVILFGSSLEERCTEISDVDIAIFGRFTKSRMYRLKSYRDFVRSVVSFDDLQDCDLLYFDSTKKREDLIIQEICSKGEVLFERA